MQNNDVNIYSDVFIAFKYVVIVMFHVHNGPKSNGTRATIAGKSMLISPFIFDVYNFVFVTSLQWDHIQLFYSLLIVFLSFAVHFTSEGTL